MVRTPRVLTSLAERIQKKSRKSGRTTYTTDQAYAIANSALHKSGHLRKGSLRLTKKGQAWRPKGPRKRK